MLINIALIVIGFALLIKGADVFVDNSVGIANRLKIPSVIVGLTIVALGTSAPEAVISVTASIQGSNGMAIGNVIGSNFLNLMFIVGLCAAIRSMPVKFSEISVDFIVSIAAACLLLALKFLRGDEIPRWGSLIMLVFFTVYMFFLIRKAWKERKANKEEEPKITRKMPILILLTVLGCAMIVGGGHLTVSSATEIATDLNISERVIGLTVLAFGTSLPELITSLVACRKGENAFALGSIIGSNIFNLLFVLGLAGIISPLQVESGLTADTIFLITGSTLVLAFTFTGNRISRREGIVMVLLYLGYMAYAVLS